MWLEFRRVLFRSDRKSTRLNYSHIQKSRMPTSACKKKKVKKTKMPEKRGMRYMIRGPAFGWGLIPFAPGDYIPFFYLIIRRPPLYTLILTLFPDTTLFR